MTEIRTKTAPDQADALWEAFAARRGEQTRNRLVEHYLPLVNSVAQRLHSGVPQEVQFDDLFSAGVFGLMDAINAFEPDRGVKFQTYGGRRIRGAILDELRAMDWAPRLVRSRAHKLKEATRRLQATLGRTPTDKELAKNMGLSQKAFQRLRSDAHPIGLVSLSRTWYQTDSQKEIREIDLLADRTVENPRDIVHRKHVHEVIARNLSFTERLIIMLYYFEELTMSEIGEALNLSESRVSQIHSAILDRLRTNAELQPQ